MDNIKRKTRKHRFNMHCINYAGDCVINSATFCVSSFHATTGESSAFLASSFFFVSTSSFFSSVISVIGAAISRGRRLRENLLSNAKTEGGFSVWYTLDDRFASHATKESFRGKQRKQRYLVWKNANPERKLAHYENTITPHRSRMRS